LEKEDIDAHIITALNTMCILLFRSACSAKNKQSIIRLVEPQPWSGEIDGDIQNRRRGGRHADFNGRD
jgi:hypothetical protein